MKIMVGKNCGGLLSLSFFFLLFSFFFILSCENPLIQRIVDSKTASFESNGGSRVDSQTVFKDRPVKRPQDPTKDGYTFDAWFSDNETFLNEWDFAAIPHSDITLYAKWNAVIVIETFTVTFDKNGGDTNANPISRTVVTGNLITAPETPPTRTDFIFAGWYKEVECINIWNFDKDTVTADITLYAKWNVIAKIAINEVNITVTQPVADAVPAVTASGEGNFTVGAVSWSPNDNPFLGGVEYTVSVTLTAHQNYAFAEGPDFTAAINGNGAAVTHNNENTVTLSYTFPPTKTVTGVAIKTPPKLDYAHGDTLDLSALVVTFTYNDGTTEDVAYNDFASRGITASMAHGTALDRPTHDGNGVTVTYGSFPPMSAGTLTVGPAPITSAALTVDAPARGGTPASAANITGGQNFTVSAVSWTPNDNPFQALGHYTVTITLAADTNYTFTGGLTTATINEQAATVSGNNGATATLSYRFPQLPDAFTVSYDINGGSGTTPAAQIVDAGGSVTLPGGSALSKSGYAFGGWNTGADGTGTNYSANSSYTPAATITLYAKWNPNQIGITFDVEELVDRAPNFDSNIIISRTGTGGVSKTATVTISGTYNSLSWEIPGVGANADTSVTGTTSPINLNAENTIYNTPGWHPVIVKVTVNGLEYQTSFRFRIVE